MKRLVIKYALILLLALLLSAACNKLPLYETRPSNELNMSVLSPILNALEQQRICALPEALDLGSMYCDLPVESGYIYNSTTKEQILTRKVPVGTVLACLCKEDNKFNFELSWYKSIDGKAVHAFTHERIYEKGKTVWVTPFTDHKSGDVLYCLLQNTDGCIGDYRNIYQKIEIE